MTNLNQRQEAFCMAYAKSGNATQAYREAGYKARTDNAAAVSAAKLLRNAKVQNLLQEIGLRVESKAVMEAREIQERLTSIIRGEVLIDGREPQIRDRLRAMELLAKMQGLFLTRKEVSWQGISPVVIVDDVKE